MAVAFANIFMVKVTREEIIEQANKQHQTIKLSSLQLKCSKQKLTFWTLLFTKVKDLEMSRC